MSRPEPNSSASRLLLIILALLLVPAATALPARAVVVDRIVAVVNGEIITLFELNRKIEPLLEQFKARELTREEQDAVSRLKRQYLEKLIDDLLLRQEVAKFGVQVSDVEVESQIREFRAENRLSEEELRQQLRLENMTREEFAAAVRQDILKHRLLGAMVRRKVVVTDEELRAHYEAHRADFIADREVRLSILAMPPGQEVEQLVRRIEAGEITFAEAADLYSDGPGAGQGGSLGLLQWKSLAPEWREALTGVDEGGMSAPFLIQGREAVLFLEETRGGAEQSFEEVRLEIEKSLHALKLEERFKNYMDQLRSTAVIDVRL